jgi:hypothetical protein
LLTESVATSVADAGEAAFATAKAMTITMEDNSRECMP